MDTPRTSRISWYSTQAWLLKLDETNNNNGIIKRIIQWKVWRKLGITQLWKRRIPYPNETTVIAWENFEININEPQSYSSFLKGLAYLIFTAIIVTLIIIFNQNNLSEFQEFLINYDKMQIQANNHTLCSNIPQNSGYLEINSQKKIFFWYFESQDKNPDAPLILWLNGGPGTSSLVGLTLGIGPCLINEYATSTLPNPHAWNSNSRILVLDQPLGTGFTNIKKKTLNSDIAAEDILLSLHSFYKQFHYLRSVPLHIASESYGGHFAPMAAHKIIQFNNLVPNSESKYLIPINSIMVGNGVLDPRYQFPAYIKMACNKSNPKLIKTCPEVKRILRNVNPLLKECHSSGPSNWACADLISLVHDDILDYLTSEQLDFYDIRNDHNIMAKNESIIERYFNLNYVQTTLGVKSTNFVCNQKTVTRAFYQQNDMIIPITPILTELLSARIRVLLYVGANDFVCNWPGIKAVAQAIPWLYQSHFQNQSRLSHLVNNELWWEYQSYRELSLVKLPEAGHFVHFNQPLRLQTLINQWIHPTMNPLH